MVRRARWSGLPDVPSVDEAGVSGFEITSWSGLAGPAGLPEPIVKQLTDPQKVQAGAGPDVVRLSIGIEDKDDLIADLDQALSAA